MSDAQPTREQLERRLERERDARRQAEAVAEKATGELYMTLEELRSVNQAMRDFVAVAAHDLRTPITTMAGFAALLNSEWDRLTDIEKRRYLAIIERSADNLTMLAENLLTVSRIEAGALETHKEVIELDGALRVAMQQFLDSTGSTPAQITINSDPRARVEADPLHVERMIMNYVGNALKYGGPPITVDVTVDGDWVEIRVRDHGEGVPEEFVPRLFARFARDTSVAAKGITGTGLGLAIVQGLAQANGGSVWYEPNHPRGSCFALKLPVAAA